MEIKPKYLLFISLLVLIAAFTAFSLNGQKEEKLMDEENLHPVLTDSFYNTSTEVFNAKDGSEIVFRGYPQSVRISNVRGQDFANATISLDNVFQDRENFTIHARIDVKDSGNIEFPMDLKLHPVEMRFIQGSDVWTFESSKILGIEKVLNPQVFNAGQWLSEPVDAGSKGTYHDMYFIRDV